MKEAAKMRSLVLVLLLALPLSAQSLGDSVADFGFDLFGRVAENKNTVVSPLSLHAAFAMLTLGAQGETREQSLEVLRMTEESFPEYETLLSNLQPQKGKLSLASRLWPRQGFHPKLSFVTDCGRFFGAAPKVLNFSEPAEAIQEINSWVSEKTESLIPNLLPPGSVDGGTELVLTNALFFEGEWLSGFRDGATSPGEFQTLSDGKVTVPMMRGRVRGGYLSDGDWEAVSLPYKESPVAMAVIVPSGELKKTHGKLGADLLRRLENGGAPQMVIDMEMPKFTIDVESRPLTTLREMGMKKLLGSQPDLSALAVSSNGLRVSECFHQARVEVDENGTRAAAATAIVITRGAVMEAVRMKVDRPFYFVLYHRSTLAPLFIGQIANPKS